LTASPASVLQATNRKTVALVVGVLVHVVVAVVHVPVVGVTTPALRSRPPVAVVADIVETAIGVSVAAGQRGNISAILR